MGEGRDREIKSFSDINLSERHKIGRLLLSLISVPEIRNLF